MSDRNERIRAAFQDDTDASWNRDRVLSGVLQHTGQVRRRRTYRRLAFAIAASLIVGVGVLRWSSITALVPTPGLERPAPSLDSISTNPAEEAVSNQQVEGAATTITRHEAPSSLIPLLGHRSSLSSDLRLLVEKRDELSNALNANPGRERADQLRAQIAGTDQDISAVRTALRVVDQQLAAIQGEVVPVTTHEAITFSESPPIIVGRSFPGDPYVFAAGISLAVLLTLLAVVFYFRRAMRAAVDALSSLQGQASTQLSALTSGIEAIAIEVERLGENQRFMSKVIAGEVKEGATPNER